MKRDEEDYLAQAIKRVNRWESIEDTLKVVGFFLVIAALIGGLIWYFAYQAEQAAKCREDCVKSSMKAETCEWICRPRRR